MYIQTYNKIAKIMFLLLFQVYTVCCKLADNLKEKNV